MLRKQSQAVCPSETKALATANALWCSECLPLYFSTTTACTQALQEDNGHVNRQQCQVELTEYRPAIFNLASFLRQKGKQTGYSRHNLAQFGIACATAHRCLQQSYFGRVWLAITCMNRGGRASMTRQQHAVLQMSQMLP